MMRRNMSDNKNEILKEQEKSNRDFLELKKIEKGEIKAPPKPSEVAVVPKTLKEKWSNFYYHYKIPFIVSIVGVIVIAIMVVQSFTKTKYDVEVVYYSHSFVIEDQTYAMANYIEDYAPDVNGDGEVNVKVINCSFDKGGDMELHYNALNKIRAMMDGNDVAVLYITDPESISFFKNFPDEKGLFEGDFYEFGQDFYKIADENNYNNVAKNLKISRRRLTDDIDGDKESVKAAYKAAEETIQNLINGKKTNSK